MMNKHQSTFQNKQIVQEGNIWAKTVAAILTAGAISAFSISGAYLLVTEVQPTSLQSAPATAQYCGEKKEGDDPEGLTNTCGEEKDGGGESSIGV